MNIVLTVSLVFVQNSQLSTCTLLEDIHGTVQLIYV